MAEAKKDHRLEDALAYKQGFLEGAELAEFEAHLRDCAACQATLESVSRFLPALDQALTMEARESDAGVLASVRAEHAARVATGAARERASGRAARATRSSVAMKLRVAWTAFAVAAAAAAYLIAQPLLRQGGEPRNPVNAPQRPDVMDAGQPDAGELEDGGQARSGGG